MPLEEALVDGTPPPPTQQGDNPTADTPAAQHPGGDDPNMPRHAAPRQPWVRALLPELTDGRADTSTRMSPGTRLPARTGTVERT